MQKGHGVEAHGENLNVGASNEPVWLKSGAVTFLTAASTLVVNSTDANDDGSPAGTGARTIRIEGLDANYKRIVEDVTLNGLTDVATAKSFLRVNKVKVLTVGSGGATAGDVEVLDSTKTYTLAFMSAGYNIAMQAIYTVPAGKTLRITDVYYSEDQNKLTNLDIIYYETGSNKPALIKNIFKYLVQGIFKAEFISGLKFTEKTDIYLAASSAAGSGQVSAGFTGYLH